MTDLKIKVNDLLVSKIPSVLIDIIVGYNQYILPELKSEIINQKERKYEWINSIKSETFVRPRLTYFDLNLNGGNLICEFSSVLHSRYVWSNATRSVWKNKQGTWCCCDGCEKWGVSSKWKFADNCGCRGIGL